MTEKVRKLVEEIMDLMTESFVEQDLDIELAWDTYLSVAVRVLGYTIDEVVSFAAGECFTGERHLQLADLVAESTRDIIEDEINRRHMMETERN